MSATGRSSKNQQSASKAAKLQVGQVVEVEIASMAHGGHGVARHEGWVIFVRYAIPGERVKAQITSTGSTFCRGDAIEILVESPDRVKPPCKHAKAKGCGGCDFQFISPTAQRKFKSGIIKEQFARLAKMDIDVEVQALLIDGVQDGVGYRTRISMHVGKDGEVGFLGARSHELYAIDDCLIAAPALDLPEVTKQRWASQDRVEVLTSSTGDRSVVLEKNEVVKVADGPMLQSEVVEVNGEKFEYQVSIDSFWQGNKKAPEVFIARVLSELEPKAGDIALDLYGGVGLFAKPLAARGCTVQLIETGASAIKDAKVNFANIGSVSIHQGDVAKYLPRLNKVDLIVLDPPRAGAGNDVVIQMAKLAPRAICYVSCDPASLARDTAYLAAVGYKLRSIAAFDAFPMTAHVECIATYIPVIS